MQISQSDFLNSLSATLNNSILPQFQLTNGYLDNIQTLMQSRIVPDLSNVAQKIENNGDVNVNLHYDSLLNVNGSVDATVVSNLQKLLKDSAEYTKKDIFDELNKLGLLRSYGG